MTESERAKLREAIDATMRERVNTQWTPDACAGCACPFDERTSGCATCYARHWRRRRAAEGWVGSVIGTHGISGYQRGCRCEVCREKFNAPRRIRRRARRTPLQQAVSA